VNVSFINHIVASELIRTYFIDGFEFTLYFLTKLIKMEGFLIDKHRFKTNFIQNSLAKAIFIAIKLFANLDSF